MKPEAPIKLTTMQRYWLFTLAGDRLNGSALTVMHDGRYNPELREQRTFDALERRGLVQWQQHEIHGGKYNGYAVTDAGRSALTASKATQP